jgi:hypothetical protein
MASYHSLGKHSLLFIRIIALINAIVQLVTSSDSVEIVYKSIVTKFTLF